MVTRNEPVILGAIDAGSNAVRVVVGEARSASDIRRIEAVRVPLRLGEGVFTGHAFPRRTLDRAVKTFRRFRRLFDRHGVVDYRAVATSATRHARNRRDLLQRVQAETGIRLEVIDSREETRLVRSAVLAASRDAGAPALIADLGGGSLDVSLLDRGRLLRGVTLPLGTVRLLDTFDAWGPLHRRRIREVSRHVRDALADTFGRRPGRPALPAVACGGNAEALARIAAGPRDRGVPTLDVAALRRLLPGLNGLAVDARVTAYGVRRERAEVMGLASIVFLELARWFSVDRFRVPGVGVRDGLLRDLALRHLGSGTALPHAFEGRALRAAARDLARRFRCDLRRGAAVRRIADTLFDGTAAVHRMGPDARLALAVAAELHDVGRAVAQDDHAAHGAYILGNADVAGLDPPLRDLVAAVVRFQGGEADPAFAPYLSLGPPRRREARILAALLGVAVAGADARLRGAGDIDVVPNGRRVYLRVRGDGAARAGLERAVRACQSFREETGRALEVRPAR